MGYLGGICAQKTTTSSAPLCTRTTKTMETHHCFSEKSTYETLEESDIAEITIEFADNSRSATFTILASSICPKTYETLGIHHKS